MASSHVGHGSYFMKKNREDNENYQYILVNQLSSLFFLIDGFCGLEDQNILGIHIKYLGQPNRVLVVIKNNILGNLC